MSVKWLTSPVVKSSQSVEELAWLMEGLFRAMIARGFPDFSPLASMRHRGSL